MIFRYEDKDFPFSQNHVVLKTYGTLRQVYEISQIYSVMDFDRFDNSSLQPYSTRTEAINQTYISIDATVV